LPTDPNEADSLDDNGSISKKDRVKKKWNKFKKVNYFYFLLQIQNFLNFILMGIECKTQKKAFTTKAIRRFVR
jgi:hypothetical protein